jgi:hypothetical protein
MIAMRFVYITALVFILSHSLYSEEVLPPLLQPTEESEPPIPREIIQDSWKQSSTGKRLVFDGTVKILFAGDVMFNWGVRQSINQYGYNLPFEDWKDIFEKSDYSFINLETTFLKEKREAFEGKAYVFAGEKNDATILKNIKVDGVFLGNNHAMDYQEEGLLDTMSILDDAKIFHLGAGRNLEEAYNPLILEGKNLVFPVFNASDVAEKNFPFAKNNQSGVAFFQESLFKKKVSEYKDSNIFPILSLHWGHEYALEPSIAQRKSAKRMLDAGFSAVVGHHPHIPQGIEIYKNKPIIYSLGNFIFGSKNRYLNHNIVVILHYNSKGLAVVEVIPSFGKFQNTDHIFLPLAPEEGDEFLKEYKILCEKLGTDLHIQAGRGYVFLDKTMISKE